MTAAAAPIKRFAAAGAARFAVGGLLLLGGALLWAGIGGGFGSGLGSLFGLGQETGNARPQTPRPTAAVRAQSPRVTPRRAAVSPVQHLRPIHRRAHAAPRVPVATNPGPPVTPTSPQPPPTVPRPPTGGGTVGGAVERVKAVAEPLPAPLAQTVDQVGQTVLGLCVQLPGGCP